MFLYIQHKFNPLFCDVAAVNLQEKAPVLKMLYLQVKEDTL